MPSLSVNTKHQINIFWIGVFALVCFLSIELLPKVDDGGRRGRDSSVLRVLFEHEDLSSIASTHVNGRCSGGHLAIPAAVGEGTG